MPFPSSGNHMVCCLFLLKAIRRVTFILPESLVSICFRNIRGMIQRFLQRWPGLMGRNFFFFLIYFYFYAFWGLYLRHMEVPRPGVELELQLPTYTTATATRDPNHICSLHCSSWQHWILNPPSEVRDRTCIPVGTSWVR